MKALCWAGKWDVRVHDVPDPKIVSPHDAVVKVTLTAICGSDLHLYDGYVPTMERGDILGHEFMGEIVDIGSAVENLKIGDRVVVPFTISCGRCWYCEHEMGSLCDNSNPNSELAQSIYGQSAGGYFGYTHMFGGFAGGQAEYVRVPFADYGPIKVPGDIPDEKVLFLSDIFPTGYQAADNCDIKSGDVIAVWGCGPVGQMAIRSALLLGADRVIAIDDVPERLEMARCAPGGAEKVHAIKFDETDVYERVMDLTGGRGADACIDAVGLEAHGFTPDAVYDRVKVAAMLATDRVHALRQAIRCCRKGGTMSVPGVYGGLADKFPIGALFGKCLTLRTGQTYMQKYMRPLLERILRNEVDPSFVITHRLPLEEAAYAYEIFSKKQDRCVKVVLRP